MTSAAAKKPASPSFPPVKSAASHGLEQVLAGKPAITLQEMILSQQGVCTEPWLFYNFSGDGWVSESSNTIYLSPRAMLRTDTFGNMVGLGTWDRACKLDGLFLAVLGTGTIEIKVFQVTTGRSYERLVCEVCELSPDVETVIDLSHYALNKAEGCIWFELLNCSDDEFATVTGARYMTRGRIAPDMKLALCLPLVRAASDKDALVRERLAPVGGLGDGPVGGGRAGRGAAGDPAACPVEQGTRCRLQPCTAAGSDEPGRSRDLGPHSGLSVAGARPGNGAGCRGAGFGRKVVHGRQWHGP